MPIYVDAEIQVFSEPEFHSLAERVVGIAFDVHQSFGRLLDEEVYKNVISGRCHAAGIVPARREVEIVVQHDDFRKSYFMDSLLANGLMVEAKVVEELADVHRAQAIHYLLLTGMHHGLLLNFRPGKVEKWFVSTSLDLNERRRFEIDDSDWQPRTVASRKLRRLVEDLLLDWGAFLQTSLYRQAITHFFGGPEIVLRRVPVYDAGRQVGTHEVCMLEEGTAVAVTGLSSGQPAMADHLRRFLWHTDLTIMDWVNLDKHQITFRTITR
ncbi:GxxExxY protein [Rosistilla oblonga]|uniref:GxxExxY protein n=1 Tax=Rosistilla oblonga TaxID=2527990 RepID=UPI003A97C3EB